MKSSVLLYAYDADYAEAKKEDLTRFLHTGKYQLMHNWDFISSAHNVCAMAAMNHVQSPLVIASTSDK